MRLTIADVQNMENESLRDATLADLTLWTAELAALNQRMIQLRSTPQNPDNRTLEDYDYTIVRIAPLYNVPLEQFHAVIRSPRTGKVLVSDTSLWRRQDGSINVSVLVHEVLALK